VISVLEATIRSLRSRFLPFVLAVLLTGSLAALAMAETLSDGTKVEHWIMPNGLRVVTRHVPDAHINVVTLCYRLGTLEDPEKQEGLADLCGQVAITARAGDVPQRQLAEIDQVRPSGWGLRVATHITELTEAAPKDVFPGVLHQMCQRLPRCRRDRRARPARARAGEGAAQAELRRERRRRARAAQRAGVVGQVARARDALRVGRGRRIDQAEDGARPASPSGSCPPTRR
jgi:hypothetical protein